MQLFCNFRNRSGDNKPILNMFEIVLSTIENKLQRVENLDRAVHHLMRKMDIMERKLSAKDAEIMTSIQVSNLCAVISGTGLETTNPY